MSSYAKKKKKKKKQELKLTRYIFKENGVCMQTRLSGIMHWVVTAPDVSDRVLQAVAWVAKAASAEAEF